MAQSIIDEIGQILPPSRNLAETLARAADYAASQSHPEITLEHLLLALTEDPDAARVLAVSAVEIDQLKGDVSNHLGRIEERATSPGAIGISADMHQILEAAAAAARGRRDAIDGAIVLAAIVGDGRSTAAHLLRAHGLTFEEAIRALQNPAPEETPDAAPQPETAPEPAPAPGLALESAPPPTAEPMRPVQPMRHPPGATADEILASARERVQGRMLPVPEPEAPEHVDEEADAEIAEEMAPDAEVASASDHGAPEEQPAPHAAGIPVQDAGPGPRPAPPVKRPLPPGALRDEPLQEREAGPAPAGFGADQGVPDDPDRAAKKANLLQSADRGREQANKEIAIDEVLASIRKSGKTGFGPSEGIPARVPVPHNGPASPGPPPPAPPPSRPAPPVAAPAPRQADGALPAPAPQRPSDRDFFGPRTPGTGPRNAASPPLPPPPPGRFSGPPIPGLPPGAPPAPGPARRSPPPQPAGAPPRSPASVPAGTRPPPSAAPAPAPAAAPPPARQRAPDVSVGEMVENIPRVMRVAIPIVVEARIGRAEVKALADGLQGGGAVWRHELTVTKAMSVRLRAPEGGFFIETSSPETQWIENTAGLITDDYASWRWTVTPRERGSKRLQLVISARTVGTDGLAAETALPDQVVDVKVRINFAKTAKRVGGWALAAIGGGLLARFGEDLPARLLSVIGTVLK